MSEKDLKRLDLVGGLMIFFSFVFFAVATIAVAILKDTPLVWLGVVGMAIPLATATFGLLIAPSCTEGGITYATHGKPKSPPIPEYITVDRKEDDMFIINHGLASSGEQDE